MAKRVSSESLPEDQASVLLGPVMDLLRHPTAFLGRLRHDREFMRLWYEDLRYYAACNFFELVRDSDTEFTLVLKSDAAKKFVKTLLEDLFASMNFGAEIQEDLGKLRVKKAGDSD